jgi:general secretion pathway protein B
MSSILKALEKVEESRSTRRSVGVNSAAKIRERRAVWVFPVCVLGGAAVATLLTYAIMGGFSRHAAPAAQLKAVASPAPVVVAPLPPVNAAPTASTQAKSATAPVGVTVVPGKSATPRLTSTPAVKVRQTVAPAAAHPAPVETAPAQAAPARDMQVPAAPAQVKPEQGDPEIRVTGIAWQNDSESSAAIVNGHPVQQGGMVDGFKVEQIFQDKVRFSGNGRSLEVPLRGGE